MTSGKGEGRKFVALPWVRDQFQEKLNISPYPGTLNLEIRVEETRQLHKWLPDAIRITPPSRKWCTGFALPAIIARKLKASVIVPEVGYYEKMLELVCTDNARRTLHVNDGSMLNVQIGLQLPSNRRLIRGIIIDMDGTLIETFEPFYTAISEALLERGYRTLTREMLKRSLDIGCSLDEILLKLGVVRAEFPQFLRSIQSHFQRVKDDAVRPISGVGEALALLRNSGIKIALATGSGAPRRIIEADLYGFGLLRYFDCVTLGREVPRRKPSPDLIETCAKKLKLDASTCLAVGDARMDVLAGKGAGCLTAAVMTGVGSRKGLAVAGPDFLEKNLLMLTERLILEGWV